MAIQIFVTTVLLALTASAAELPSMRIEPAGGGSVIYLRNGSTEALTAWLIELAGYPGSSFSLLQDELANPIPPGGERRIPVSNMMVGAAPDYVKVQAALYVDGSSSGLPEKIPQVVGRRRAVLETTRELIRRLESPGTEKAAAIAGLKEWAGSMQPSARDRNSQTAVSQAAARSTIAETVGRLEAHSLEETLTALRASERMLAASKPAL